MIFSANTLKIGGKILVPDSHVNSVDYGVISDKTTVGIYVTWHKGTTNEQKGYITYVWLNSHYGSHPSTEGARSTDLPDDVIPNLC